MRLLHGQILTSSTESYKFYHTAISYVSYVQYALSAMIISQYDGEEFECSEELQEIADEQAAAAAAEYQMEAAAGADPYAGYPYAADPYAGAAPPEMECVVEGKVFIEELGMVTENYWANIGALVILLAFFVLTSAILLVMFRRRR